MVKQIRLCNVAMNASLLHTISYARSHPVTKCRDESIIFYHIQLKVIIVHSTSYLNIIFRLLLDNFRHHISNAD